MRLTVISSHESKEDAASVLRAACERSGIEYRSLDAATADLTMAGELGTDDLLYRVATTSRARAFEQTLLNEHCSSLYSDWRRAFDSRSASFFLHQKLGLPVVPSYPVFPVSTDEIEHCLAIVGPFPVVVKVRGGSLGVGVIRVDSVESLRSLADYLVSKEEKVLIRKYIEHEYYVRAVVLGSKVVTAHATYSIAGEFRTNAEDGRERQRAPYVPEEALERNIVRAVQALGLEFGGVDLLVGTDGMAYITEVNFPFDFFATQKVTGFDIAGALVGHLAKKAADRRVSSV